MEYFILMATLLVLVCGLIFIIPPEAYPSTSFRKIVDVISLVIIIGSTVAVVGMSML